VDAWLESLGEDPVAVLRAWLGEAREAGLHEPEAAALATATPDAVPSVRMVLVRGIDESGLRFYTNYESRKAAELGLNPHAALAFHWRPPLQRQVRVEGLVERLAEEDSLAYFRARPRESRLGAWASAQSHPLADRDELDDAYRDVEARFAGDEDVPLPPFWGGYRLVPQAMELWQGRPNRLHDRARYERADLVWSRVRLAP
jgi:pyridoxamine 5'-phosphate oxidase